jgi:protein involved in polysaccharide export with SLBB domain
MKLLTLIRIVFAGICLTASAHAGPTTKPVAKDERITVNVFGAVKKSGAVKLLTPCSVLDALGASGGYTTKADIAAVVVLRGLPGEKPEKILVDVSAILRGDAPMFLLKNKDTITVAERHF